MTSESIEVTNRNEQDNESFNQKQVLNIQSH